eukprot:CAMPEP_0195148230 /NCGR_PEP_ID=MMETSP0448-20130528/174867_1 /TAXON_ID=66468 /ORGANISM="Heterocapsa triquestra, Strain CCMP 448" /LENGTH=124 /DNA_ID=CAMNT_0040186833 /DNA_START=9 /DNA_END=379 /DNA_ORIENTATION=+
MTRWLPAEKMQLMSDGTQKQQLSVRSMFLEELWPRLCAQRLREPIYNLEAQHLCYNPNLVRAKIVTKDGLKEGEEASDSLATALFADMKNFFKTEGGDDKAEPLPEAHKDHIRRHAEEMANTVP